MQSSSGKEIISAIIVEDEYHPRETLLQKLAEYHPEIEVVAMCGDAETALVEIVRYQPKLLFLDIQLPGKNGLWLADQMHRLSGSAFIPPGIIFTTAFNDSEYLLSAIRVAAIDYLVKPILIENLSLAIARFRKQINGTSDAHKLMDAIQREKMFRFKSLNGLLLLRAEDIVYVEGDRNYARMGLSNGEYEAIFERLGEVEQALPSDTFLRVGKSLIINKYYVRRINARKSTVQLVASLTEYTVEVSAGALKVLKELE
jgi:Response regulator of the LytR/AlgR family